MGKVTEAASFRNISASALIETGKGRLLGIFVATVSGSPTIKVWAQTSAAAPIVVNTFIPVAATYYKIPSEYTAGLYVTIGGTVDCTVFFDQY